MRLSVSVNGQRVVRASLETLGYLSATVRLSSGVEDAAPDGVSLIAFDTNEDPNSVTSRWDGYPLSLGDRVEIAVLTDGGSDPPDEVTKTSESPRNLFSDVEVARALLAAVKSCDVALMAVASQADAKEPADEMAKVNRALGDVLWELDRALISPTLRRHPDLLAEAQALGIR